MSYQTGLFKKAKSDFNAERNTRILLLFIMQIQAICKTLFLSQ